MEEADENGDSFEDCPVYGEVRLVDLKSKKGRNNKVDFYRLD